MSTVKFWYSEELAAKQKKGKHQHVYIHIQTSHTQYDKTEPKTEN